MGGYCSRQKPHRILFAGLDAAGKTTILYQLKLGEVVTTIPTIGFNVETVTQDGLEITVWDVGMRDKMRPLLRHYLPNTDGLVFVVDSCDRERLGEAVEFLGSFIIEDELRDCEFMILANKQDLPNAMSASEIEHRLMANVKGDCRTNSLFVMPSCANTRQGLRKAFSVFAQQLKLRRKGEVTPGWKSFLHTIEEPDGKSEGEADELVKSDIFSVASLCSKPVEVLKSLLKY